MPGPRLGVLGRLSHEKGVDVFLEALQRIHQAGVPASAYIVGDGPARVALEDSARALGLADSVAFVGHRADVQTVYRSVDMVVIPSRSEGLPNVLLEALAADRYVVATGVGAIPEVLTDRGLGIVVPPGQADALATAVIEALAEPARRPEPEARRQALTRLSVERRAEAHAGMYRELISGFRE